MILYIIELIDELIGEKVLPMGCLTDSVMRLLIIDGPFRMTDSFNVCIDVHL